MSRQRKKSDRKTSSNSSSHVVSSSSAPKRVESSSSIEHGISQKTPSGLHAAHIEGGHSAKGAPKSGVNQLEGSPGALRVPLPPSRMKLDPSTVRQRLPSIREQPTYQSSCSTTKQPLPNSYVPSRMQNLPGQLENMRITRFPAPQNHYSPTSNPQGVSQYGESSHQPSPGVREPTGASQSSISNRNQDQSKSMMKQPLASTQSPPPAYTTGVASQSRVKPLEPAKPSPFVSRAPPNTKSILTNPEDVKFASRQTRIESLPPAQRQEQEKWAASKIKLCGACPQNYDWVRRPGGYQCTAGGHGVTDELLAEGKGGLMGHPALKWDVATGPYYEMPEKPGYWMRWDGKGMFLSAEAILKARLASRDVPGPSSGMGSRNGMGSGAGSGLRAGQGSRR